MMRIVKYLLWCCVLLSGLSCAGQGRTVRILAIGNSFSMDAVEENLWELAAADGVSCEIGNMYIGGCSIERHLKNARNDAAAYEYRKIVGGIRTVRDSVSLREALCDGEWDYVSVQQVSQLSGLYSSYIVLLPALLDYIRLYAPQAVIVLHETWAYAADSDHSGFRNYDCDQRTMYEAIRTTVERAASENGIGTIVYAGTAIQNARGTAIGDNLTRDGYHLNALGRYTAACAWYAALFGADVRTNGYFRTDISPELQRLAREAAAAAAF